MTRTNRPIVIWLFTGCFLVYCMVVIGAITRLTHSGLSMVEWNMVVGSMPPLTDKDWQLPFEKYKESPEYKKINYDFTLSDFKKIYWWEYIHRFLGRFIGFVFIAGFFWFVIRKKFPEGFIKKMYVLLALGALQGFIGWFMVKSGLVNNPYVSHYRLAIHLLAAFTVFAFTFTYALDLLYPENEKFYSLALKRTTLAVFALLLLQIVYGAFVAGLKAGYLYPTFPKMGNAWFPDEITVLNPVWKNYIEGKPGVQFVHRYLAYAVVLAVVLLYFKAKKHPLTRIQNKTMNFIVAIVVVQFILGALTLVLQMPLTIAVLHQTFAFVLFAAFVFLMHRMRRT